MILSRRGTFGLAAILGGVGLARPAAAHGVTELRSLEFGTCLGGFLEDGQAASFEDYQAAVNRQIAAATGIPARALEPAPWGWDTLENVR